MAATSVTRVLLIALTVVGLACGIGSPAHAQGSATITLMNALPGVPVVLIHGDDAVLNSARPGLTSDLSRFSGSTVRDVSLKDTRSLAGRLAGPIDLSFPSAGTWTLLAHLDAAGVKTLTWIQHDVSPVPAEHGRLAVVHAAALPAVDLVVGAERPITQLKNGAVASVVRPAGMISGARVAIAGQAPSVDVPPVDLKAGTDMIVYVAGPGADGRVAFYTQKINVGQSQPTGKPSGRPAPSSSPPSAPPTTEPGGNASTVASLALASDQRVGGQVSLIHGIPGASVDVLLAGQVVYANLQPKASLDITAFAGGVLPQLEVRLAGTSRALVGPVDVAIPQEPPVQSLLLNLTTDGNPQLSVVVPNISTLPLLEAGRGGLAVVHAAAAPAVDVVVGNQRPITKLNNGAIATVALSSGTIAGATLAPTGGAAVANIPAFPIEGGTLTMILVIGSANNGTLDFIVQTFRLTAIDPPDPTSSASNQLPITGSPLPAPAGGPWGWALLVAASAVVVMAALRRGLFRSQT